MSAPIARKLLLWAECRYREALYVLGRLGEPMDCGARDQLTTQLRWALLDGWSETESAKRQLREGRF